MSIYSWPTPNVSEAEIRAFGESIGITFPPLLYHPAHERYPHEGNVLHELGHYAVVPQFMIDWWIKEEKVNIDTPGLIPNQFNYIYWYASTQIPAIKQLREELKEKLNARKHDVERYPRMYLNFKKDIEELCPSRLPYIIWLDEKCKESRASYCFFPFRVPIPDEWAVQEWCVQVKQKLGWTCSTSWWDGWNCAYLLNDVIERTDRKAQLSIVGIDIENGVYRPTLSRIDFRNHCWRGFAKRKMLFKVPILPQDKSRKITGYCF